MQIQQLIKNTHTCKFGLNLSFTQLLNWLVQKIPVFLSWSKCLVNTFDMAIE